MTKGPYWHGCNYPWSAADGTVYYGLDFGANVWGTHLGVSTRRVAVARDFVEMAALGFTVARWFVFGDGRAGIVYDESGMPAGPDPALFADLDAGLEISRAVGIRLDLVLLDHRWMFDGLDESIADPATGEVLEATLPFGRSHVLSSRVGRDALIDAVLSPIVRRYGRQGARADLGPQILAFELMNEPDFVVEEWERDLSPRVRRPLPFTAMADLVSRLSDLIHAHTASLATIGCARLHNLWAWDTDALGLDVLQLHTYPDLGHPDRDVDVFGTPAAALGVSRGVILGEFPGNGRLRHPARASPPPTTLDAYLEFAVRGGYRGAWPWSFSGTDDYGRLPREPLFAFARSHPEVVNSRCAAL